MSLSPSVGFFDLAAELRLEICEMWFEADPAKHEAFFGLNYKKTGEESHGMSMNVLRVNRQIYYECRAIIMKKQFAYRIPGNGPKDYYAFQVARAPRDFIRNLVRLAVHVPPLRGTSADSVTANARMLDEIERLVKDLEHCENWRLLFIVGELWPDDRPDGPQLWESSLEPFRRLRGIPRVSIRFFSKCRKSFNEQLVADMTSPRIQEILDETEGSTVIPEEEERF